jgi:hypothetical protein
MTTQSPHFPPEIEALPEFTGPSTLPPSSRGMRVLFVHTRRHDDHAPHTHGTNNVGVITRSADPHDRR